MSHKISLAFFSIILFANLSFSQSITGNLKDPAVEKLEDGFLLYGHSKTDGEKN